MRNSLPCSGPAELRKESSRLPTCVRALPGQTALALDCSVGALTTGDCLIRSKELLAFYLNLMRFLPVAVPGSGTEVSSPSSFSK